VDGALAACPANHTCRDGAVVCHAQVGATVRWNGTACEARCRPSTFQTPRGCLPRPRVSKPEGLLSFAAVSRVRHPVPSLVSPPDLIQLSDFTPSASDFVAVRIDGGAWMAWNPRYVGGALLLPSPVRVRARVRVCDSRVVREFVGRPPRAPATLGVPPSAVAFHWGDGRGGLGDTQALCSVAAPPGMALVALQSNATFARWDLDCRAPEAPALLWLAQHTEIQGVSFQSFLQEECRRGTSAWLMPQTARAGAQAVSVSAVAL
jgi:hypothetical protein